MADDVEISHPPSAICVRGARSHNLRNVDVEIPLGSLTVITGVSGSGKSSLAFDTIYAEGRYRYLSTMSVRSRELLQSIERPDVDSIENLPPVLCVEQQMRGVRQRSTVATASEIYDFLRLVYARVGQLYCPNCRKPVVSQSRSTIVASAMQFPERQKVVVLAPVIRQQVGQHADIFARIIKDGYVRARVDGETVDAADPPKLDAGTPHDIEIVVDRLIVKEGVQSRFEESIDLALQLGQGQCILSRDVDGVWQDHRYSTIPVCETCGTRYPDLEPRLFSFHSALGACPNCRGLGVIAGPDDSELACQECHGSRLGAIPRSILVGSVGLAEFCGLGPMRALETVSRWTRKFLDQSAATADSSDTVTPAVTEAQRSALRHLLPEISARLTFLAEVGLDYLTLDRGCATLSAGELQRTRLSACLGNQLTGVCYILDEPTAGLHSRDTDRLLRTLNQLKADGNTVLLVEHDLEVIRQADHVIDLGPGAGRLGGTILAADSPDRLETNPNSVTGRFLAKLRDRHSRRSKAARKRRQIEATTPTLRLTGATLHNLNDVTMDVPLKKIVCVTGVSGSGKSSLIMQTLVPAVRQSLGERSIIAGPYQELTGTEQISRLIRVDQRPLGRSARSCPATYSGSWDHIRQIFGKTKESRLRGFNARRFSLNDPEARCPVCLGRGELPVEENRLSDWTVQCPECHGQRFSPSALSVRYRGLTVADVLDLSIADAATFFANFEKLSRVLNLFNDLGLGYLKLGQSAATLSGGEAQRIKLGTELAKSHLENRSTLFVLDEPTSGLHAADVMQLVTLLKRLVAQGHSVLVIEHNVEFIAQSDWMIEIGPGAGPEGGNVVWTGPPEESIL